MRPVVISGIRPSFPGLSRNQGQVTHVLLTRSPLIHPDASTQASAFDLHVLSTQPAFVLSQDQTLHKKLFMLQNESQQDSQPDHGGDRSWPNKCLTRKTNNFWHHKLSSNKHAIGFSNHKHTPITTTQTRPRSLGASVSLSPPHTRTNRTELAFVLVRPGRNPVLRTMFPAGQRDITLDQPNPATQIQTPPPPREPHHMTTARIAQQLYSSPSVPVLPPISPSRRVNDQLKASPSAVLPFEHDQALCCRAFLGASLPCADRRRRRRIRVHRPESARRAARLGLRDSHHRPRTWRQ
jgi:hypothetical protein